MHPSAHVRVGFELAEGLPVAEMLEGCHDQLLSAEVEPSALHPLCRPGPLDISVRVSTLSNEQQKRFLNADDLSYDKMWIRSRADGCRNL